MMESVNALNLIEDYIAKSVKVVIELWRTQMEIMFAPLLIHQNVIQMIAISTGNVLNSQINKSSASVRKSIPDATVKNAKILIFYTQIAFRTV